MTKEIERVLKHALINNGDMALSLYKYELEELVDELRSSMDKDNDAFIFSITENNGDVAMVLIEATGKMYINEQAREKLKTLWLDAYESNMKKLIPDFAKQLINNVIPINGVKMGFLA